MKTMTTLVRLTAGALGQLASVTAAGLYRTSQLELAASPSGRVVLHVLAVWRDHRFAWHLSGIAREFTRA